MTTSDEQAPANTEPDRLMVELSITGARLAQRQARRSGDHTGEAAATGRVDHYLDQLLQLRGR